jgi:uncharacterized protein (UPF0335 family)
MNVSRDQLRSFVERIERLEEEKLALANDIRDVYGEAKAMGFDAKALRQIVRERAQDVQERDEFEAILDTYRAALGMLGSDDDSEMAAQVSQAVT